MKQPSLRYFLASSALLLAGSHLATADIIIMKDGKKYEKATVKTETPEMVTFEYFVAGKIKDTRTEAKASVLQVIREKPETLEMIELRKLLPTADLMTADKYEQLITDTMRPFASKYPGTPEAAETEKMIKTLQEEKEKVVSGQLKMEGQWLSADTVKRDTHSIDAYKVRSEVNRLAAEGKYREALIVWDKLKDGEDGFTDTLHYVAAIPEVQAILAKYKDELTLMLREQPIIQKRRDDNMKGLVEPDLSRTTKAIEAEKSAFKSQYDIEKKTRIAWTSVYKFDKKSIEEALKDIIDEQAKLTVIDTTKLKAQNEALTAVYRYVADKNLEQAELAMARAMEASTHESSKAITSLKQKITALKAEINKKRQQTRIYNTSASKNGGAEADKRVAEVIAGGGKDKDEKMSASEQIKAEKAVKAQTEAEERKAKRNKIVSVAPVEEEGGFTTYLIFGGVGLLAVLLGAMFLQKKKKAEE
jgi:hypothetical protein